MPKTILAIGAHYDDCVFGLPGVLLQAAHEGHRVVILSMIGDYGNWPPAHGRGEEVLKVSKELAHHYGIEMRFLSYASGRFHLNEEAKLATAKVVAEVQPDIVFMLWPHDRHPDHEAASAVSRATIRLAGRIVDKEVKVPAQIYLYDNGPGHTVGFEPNTYVDISTVWPTAMEWLGRLMAFVRKTAYDPANPDPAQVTKTTLARYRGLACGAKYAEAFSALQTRPTRIF